MRTQDSPIQKLANLKHRFQSIRANLRHGFPYKKLKIIGVTGTDGKTTTTMMIYHILKQNKIKAAYISTIKAQIGNNEIDTGFHVTTPEPWDVPKYLDMMVKAGTDIAILETTSQGLEQNRLWGMNFDAAAITNIKSDHLDYHRTWENYAKSKFKILEKLSNGGLAVLNKDDAKSYDWLKKNADKLNEDNRFNILWYSKNDVKNFKYSVDGLKFKYKGVDFALPLLGEYNLENALAAINICNKYLRLPLIAKALKSFQTPNGRMEIIQKKPFISIIDFAHTPNALENALKSLAPLRSSGGRIIAVFGCAGKRDKKRREMGRIAGKLADIIVITAEDPRTENLFEINYDIINYAHQAKGEVIKRFKDDKNFRATDIKSLETAIDNSITQDQKPIIVFDEESIQNRIDAIELATKIAKEGDIVFLTGKAHEESLCFGSTEYPWNEHTYLKHALKALHSDKK